MNKGRAMNLGSKWYNARQKSNKNVGVHTPFMGFVNNDDTILQQKEILK